MRPKSPKPAKNGRFCRPAISSSKWGASLLKVTYGFLWLWSSYFSLTAAKYNTHELFNISLPIQMGIFSPQSTFRLSLYRTIQVIPASKSTPIPGSNFRVWKWSEPSKNLPWKQLTIDPSYLGKGSIEKKRFLSGIARIRGGGRGSTHAQIFWPSF